MTIPNNAHEMVSHLVEALSEYFAEEEVRTEPSPHSGHRVDMRLVDGSNWSFSMVKQPYRCAHLNCDAPIYKDADTDKWRHHAPYQGYDTYHEAEVAVL